MNNIALFNHISVPWDFPGGSVVKNPSASAGDAGDMSLIPGSRRSSGRGNGKNHSSILAWKIPWTEELGRLYSPWNRRVGHN